MTTMDKHKKDLKVLEAGHHAWVALASARERRRRYLRYTYGDQWSDVTRDRFGNLTTEGELFADGGRAPVTNNLIRRMVKAVVGRYRMDSSAARAAEDDGLGQWRRFNALDELDARSFEEFLISGMAIHHVWAARRPAGAGIWVDAVSPDRFFISGTGDFRGTDTEMVGRLLDMSFSELVMRFGRCDRRRTAWLRELYGSLPAVPDGIIVAPSASGAVTDFFHAPDGRCRVVEVWTLECRARLKCHDVQTATLWVGPAEKEADVLRENRRRRREGRPQIAMKRSIDVVWHCRMFAPDGTVLDEYDSPLPTGCHPFAVKLYPLVDGDVHSLVEDVIDQQRHVNRLLSVMDRMLSSAAKGVLLFPEGCKFPDYTWEEVARRWADPGGVIPYRAPRAGEAEPHQVVTPMADLGVHQLLQTQIAMFEDVSGVSRTFMGKAGSCNVGAERYSMEVENASVAVGDLLKTFSHFTGVRDALMLRWLQAYPEFGQDLLNSN